MSQRMDRSSRKSARSTEEQGKEDLPSIDGLSRLERAVRAAEDGNRSLWVRASLMASGLNASHVNALFAAVDARPHAERGSALQAVHPMLALRYGLVRTFGKEGAAVAIHRESQLPGTAEGVTVDAQVHLAPGRFDLGTQEGRVRLGHEVAHSVQQRRGERSLRRLRRTDRHALESEAERAGHAFARGERFDIRGRAPARAALYRGPGPETDPSYEDGVLDGPEGPEQEDPKKKAKAKQTPSTTPTGTGTNVGTNTSPGPGAGVTPVAGGKVGEVHTHPGQKSRVTTGEQKEKVGGADKHDEVQKKVANATTPHEQEHVAGTQVADKKTVVAPQTVLRTGTKESSQLAEGWQTFDAGLQAGLTTATGTIEGALRKAQDDTRKAVKAEVKHLATHYKRAKRDTTNAYDHAIKTIHDSATANRATIDARYATTIAAIEGQRQFAHALVINNFAMAEAEYRARGEEAIQVADATLTGYKTTAASIRDHDPGTDSSLLAGNMPQRRYEARMEAATKVHDDAVAGLRQSIEAQIVGDPENKIFGLRDPNDPRRAEAVKQIDSQLDHVKTEYVDVLHTQLNEAITTEEKQLVKQATTAKKAQLALLAKVYKEGKTKLEANGEDICAGLAQAARAAELSMSTQVQGATIELQGQLAGNVFAIDQQIKQLEQALAVKVAPHKDSHAEEEQAAQLEKLKQQREKLRTGVAGASEILVGQGGNVAAQLVEGAGTVAAQLAESAKNAVAGLKPFSAKLEEMFTHTAASAKKQAHALEQAATKSFAAVAKRATDDLSAFDKELPGVVNKMVDGHRDMLFSEALAYGTNLKKWVLGADMEGQREPAQSLNQKMGAAGDKAASEVQPAWKNVLKVILKVLVALVIIIAVIALSALIGPLVIGLLATFMTSFLAAVIGGAIVGAALGAASGAVLQIANNAIDIVVTPGVPGPDGKPISWDTGVKQQMITGLWTGAIGGAFGGGLGTFLRPVTAMKIVASNIINFLANAGISAWAMSSSGHFDLGSFIESMSIGTAISVVMTMVASRGRARMTFQPTEAIPVLPSNRFMRFLDGIGARMEGLSNRGQNAAEGFVQKLTNKPYITYDQAKRVAKINIIHDDANPWSTQELIDLQQALRASANPLSKRGIEIKNVVKTQGGGYFDPETQTLYIPGGGESPVQPQHAGLTNGTKQLGAGGGDDDYIDFEEIPNEQATPGQNDGEQPTVQNKTGENNAAATSKTKNMVTRLREAGRRQQAKTNKPITTEKVTEVEVEIIDESVGSTIQQKQLPAPTKDVVDGSSSQVTGGVENPAWHAPLELPSAPIATFESQGRSGVMRTEVHTAQSMAASKLERSAQTLQEKNPLLYGGIEPSELIARARGADYFLITEQAGTPGHSITAVTIRDFSPGQWGLVGGKYGELTFVASTLAGGGGAVVNAAVDYVRSLGVDGVAFYNTDTSGGASRGFYEKMGFTLKKETIVDVSTLDPRVQQEMVKSGTFTAGAIAEGSAKLPRYYFEMRFDGAEKVVPGAQNTQAQPMVAVDEGLGLSNTEDVTSPVQPTAPQVERNLVVLSPTSPEEGHGGVTPTQNDGQAEPETRTTTQSTTPVVDETLPPSRSVGARLWERLRSGFARLGDIFRGGGRAARAPIETRVPIDTTGASSEHLAVIKGMEQVNAGELGVHYSFNVENASWYKPEMYDGHANPAYWVRTGDMTFQLRSGVSASEAIKAFLKGPTVAECNVTMVALEVNAIRESLGDALFDQRYGAAGQEVPSGRRLELQAGFSGPFADFAKVTASTGPLDLATLQPGAWLYYSNYSTYLQKHPAGFWQGENCIYAGTRNGEPLFTGMGVAAMPLSEFERIMVEQYNADRTPEDLKALETMKKKSFGRLPARYEEGAFKNKISPEEFRADPGAKAVDGTPIDPGGLQRLSRTLDADKLNEVKTAQPIYTADASLPKPIATPTAAQPLVDALSSSGKLPDNYYTRSAADKAGLKYGDKTESGAVSKFKLGGDEFPNAFNLLPMQPGRTWFQADYGPDRMMGGNLARPFGRLCWSNDGLLYVSKGSDVFGNMQYIGRWKGAVVDGHVPTTNAEVTNPVVNTAEPKVGESQLGQADETTATGGYMAEGRPTSYPASLTKQQLLALMIKEPPRDPAYVPPKNRDPWISNARVKGWLAANGDIWVPEDHNGTHAAHWDVQLRADGYSNTNGYTKVYPAIDDPITGTAQKQVAQGYRTLSVDELGTSDDVELVKLFYPDMVADLMAGLDVPVKTGEVNLELMALLTRATNKEIALVRVVDREAQQQTKPGEKPPEKRILRPGFRKDGQDVFSTKDVTTVIAHTHPHGTLWFSPEDIAELSALGYKSSVVAGPDGSGVRLPVKPENNTQKPTGLMHESLPSELMSTFLSPDDAVFVQNLTNENPSAMSDLQALVIKNINSWKYFYGGDPAKTQLAMSKWIHGEGAPELKRVAEKTAASTTVLDTPEAVLASLVEKMPTLGTLNDVQLKLLADAKRLGIRIEAGSRSVTIPGSVAVDRAVVMGPEAAAIKHVLHELSHATYHQAFMWTDNQTEIFLREVDAHLYEGESLAEAVRAVSRFYPMRSIPWGRILGSGPALREFLQECLSQSWSYSGTFRMIAREL